MGFPHKTPQRLEVKETESIEGRRQGGEINKVSLIQTIAEHLKAQLPNTTGTERQPLLRSFHRRQQGLFLK